ncbi:MAG TPA: NAD(P)-binding domain-containing protein [Gemmatimonadales bacterium]|nr:NAD(P)-binding domain-containing protein [Gemmatimonadales bacterium]
MKIGILGSGAVAKTLGAGFLRHGHTVLLGTRDPAKLGDWNREHAAARIGSFQEAAGFAEVVVLAVKGSAALDVLGLAGGAALAGKPILDTTNPISAAPHVNGVLQYFTSINESLMERLQQAYPAARLVKCFSSVGNARMVNPTYAEGRPTMFICGNDAGAKQTATALLDQFGWETLDLGGVEGARGIEPLCITWCIPGILHHEWTHAFKVLHSPR